MIGRRITSVFFTIITCRPEETDPVTDALYEMRVAALEPVRLVGSPRQRSALLAELRRAPAYMAGQETFCGLEVVADPALPEGVWRMETETLAEDIAVTR